MELWVPATLAAALFQTARFALQKRLKGRGLSATGATWARFLWSAPFLAASLAVWILGFGAEVPPLSPRFWVFAALGGLGQILATVAVVALFSLRHFAVGITLKKTEVLLTVLAGWAILGETVGAASLAAMALGVVALVLLSGEAGVSSWRALTGRAMALGLFSGVCFALAGVAYRGATLALGDGPVAFRAALALGIVTLGQTAAMAAWFLWRDRAEARRVLAAWRPGIAVGLAGLAGSFCWFVAFAEQTAALVYALGQVELLFSVAGGALLFGERLTRREGTGILLLTLSLVALVLTT